MHKVNTTKVSSIISGALLSKDRDTVHPADSIDT